MLCKCFSDSDKNTRDGLPVIEGRNEVNARDQIAFCAFHSFVVEVQAKMGSFVPCMRYSNLEIRIASLLVARN